MASGAADRTGKEPARGPPTIPLPCGGRLLTDKYELTCCLAALRTAPPAGGPHSRCSPGDCPRAAGTGGGGRDRAVVLEALGEFVFDDAALDSVASFLNRRRWTTCAVSGSVATSTDTARASCTSSAPPVLTITGSFAECVVLETLTLSDPTTTARRLRRRLDGQRGRRRPLIEMGSHAPRTGGGRRGARRLHRRFRRHFQPGGPAGSTACPHWAPAHAFTMLHTGTDPGTPDSWERAAFRAQVDALGVGTTLLVDTYDVTAGWPMRSPSPAPGWARCASTLAISGAGPARSAPNSTPWGATGTRIVVSGDLDKALDQEALRADPVDSYGVGTRWSPDRAHRRRAWSSARRGRRGTGGKRSTH